jgi:hypothetical protein
MGVQAPSRFNWYRLKLHILVGADEDELTPWRCFPRKSLSDLMEQPGRSRIIVESQSMDLTHKCLPSRHHHSATLDFDFNFFICNLAK